jgi:hypothetical protein
VDHGRQSLQHIVGHKGADPVGGAMIVPDNNSQA